MIRMICGTGYQAEKSSISIRALRGGRVVGTREPGLRKELMQREKDGGGRENRIERGWSLSHASLKRKWSYGATPHIHRLRDHTVYVLTSAH